MKSLRRLAGTLLAVIGIACGVLDAAPAPARASAAQVGFPAPLSADYTLQSIGMSGHGAAFDVTISPHDTKTLIADCDMGAVYTSHDAGKTWTIHNCGGRVWDIQADPSTPGTFYAAGSGLWKTADNGDSWQLLWPDPAKVDHTPSKLHHTRTYYFSHDSYPDNYAVESVRVDPQDPAHLVATATPAVNYANTASNYRSLYESFDGGASFTRAAQYQQLGTFGGGSFCWKYSNWENARVFVDHAASSATSRVFVAIPDGIFELNRAEGSMTKVYPTSATTGFACIQDAQQVIDATGVHYVVLENVDDATAASLGSRQRLWHTTDFADAAAHFSASPTATGKTHDLTPELNKSLPRHFNLKEDLTGAEHTINLHTVKAVCAPSLQRMYLSYSTFDASWVTGTNGLAGLVVYDASKPSGDRFYWAYGLRLYWSGPDKDKRITPDANCLMERGHCDSMYGFFNVAASAQDPRVIATTNHVGVNYSPDIDADVGKRPDNAKYGRVNLYPRNTTPVRTNRYTPDGAVYATNGLEVTVAEVAKEDPFDSQHVLLGMDDAGLAESHDGGYSWVNHRLTTVAATGKSAHPKIGNTQTDTCFDVLFDEGKQGVVYAVWGYPGGDPDTPSKTFLTGYGAFARSTDGGRSWDGATTGWPEKCVGVKLGVVYPRDAEGTITSGERTIYAATMGYGFLVSHDSGKSFSPMNTGIPALTAEGKTDTVWALDVCATSDGRLFGITQYTASYGKKDANGNSSYYATQEAKSFGNVWEWDFDAKTWVRLPFNSEGGTVDDPAVLQLRQPQAMTYDAASRTLWIAGSTVIGPSVGGEGYLTSRWTNFGGGLYTYTAAEGAAVGTGTCAEVNRSDPALGATSNLAGIGLDPAGNLWVGTENGSIYLRKKGASTWTRLTEGIHCQGLGFSFGAGGTVYYTTDGAGAAKITPAAGAQTHVTMGNEALFSAVCASLDAQGVSYTKDAEARRLSFAPGVLQAVQELDLSGKGISSLAGLDGFAWLRTLDVSDNSLASLAPVGDLTRLEVLEASDNQLTGAALEELKPASSLTELSLARNLLADAADAGAYTGTTYTYLRGLTSLEKADLSGNGLRYLTGLPGATLTWLDVSNNHIVDYTGLNNLKQLRHLSLADNNKQSATQVHPGSLVKINELAELTYLDFSNNSSPELVNRLSGLAKLKTLLAAGNSITNPTKLLALPALTTLVTDEAQRDCVSVTVDGVDVAQELLAGAGYTTEHQAVLKVTKPTGYSVSVELSRDGSAVVGGTSVSSSWERTCQDLGAYVLRVSLTPEAGGTTTSLVLPFSLVSCVHAWGPWTVTTPATCMREGVETRVCGKNTTHSETRSVAKAEHTEDGGTVTREATAEREGELTYRCRVCGEVLRTLAIPRTGGGDEDVPATEGQPSTAQTPGSPVTAGTPGSPTSPTTSDTPQTADKPASPKTSASPEDPARPDEDTTPAGHWEYVGNAWRYVCNDGGWATGWVWDGANWYLLDRTGALVSGWAWDAGEWYYLDERHDGQFGAMRCGWWYWAGGWYWLNPDSGQGLRGHMMRHSWVADRSAWYYVDADGRMATGWIWDGAGWYWLDAEGRMAANTRTPDGAWLGPTGRWVA